MVKVEIYTGMLCGFCEQAKRLLDKKSIKYIEIDTSFDPSQRDIMTKRANGKFTVPQIFIQDQYIGGCDELYELERNNNLDKLLKINEK